MQHRHRRNKIKREHTIIDGILPALEQIAAHPGVQAITPGRIKQRSGNRSNDLSFQYRTETGLKLIARSNRAVQEVFVVTDRPEAVLADLVTAGLVTAEPAAVSPKTEDFGGPTLRVDTSTHNPSSRNTRAQSTSADDASSNAATLSTAGTTAASAEVAPAELGPANVGPTEVASATAPTDGAAASTGDAPASTADPSPARPHGRRTELRDAISDEIRKKMLDLVHGKAPDKGGASPQEERRRPAGTNRGRSATGTTAEEAPHPVDAGTETRTASLRPPDRQRRGRRGERSGTGPSRYSGDRTSPERRAGPSLWEEILRRHQELLALEARLVSEGEFPPPPPSR